MQDVQVTKSLRIHGSMNIPKNSFRKNSTFSEHGHIAYGITQCSNMVASILPADPPSPDPRGQKVKILLFQNMVMLHIKLNGIAKCSIMVANILPADTLGIKRSKFNFFRAM